MSKDLFPDHFLPKDFADYASATVQRHLVAGISLGPLTLLTLDPTAPSDEGVQQPTAPLLRSPTLVSVDTTGRVREYGASS